MAMALAMAMAMAMAVAMALALALALAMALALALDAPSRIFVASEFSRLMIHQQSYDLRMEILQKVLFFWEISN